MKTAQKVVLILVAVLLTGFCAVDYLLPGGVSSLLPASQTASTVSGDASPSGSADASAEDAGDAAQDASSASDADAEAVTTEVTIPQYDLTVCLDPGHGGNDPGCVTEDGREESADVLNLALLVKEKLEFYGVTVVMTRETDQYVSLSDRCAAANDASADLFVSLHRNILTEDLTACGVEAWVEAKYTQEEYDLAANILTELRLAGIQEMRGISSGTETSSTRNYYVCSVTDMPAVLLELGFMSNEEDNTLYDTNMDAYAQAIADGLIATWVQYGGESVGEETYSVSLVNSYIIAQQARAEDDGEAEVSQTDESQPVSGTVNDTVNLRSGPGTDYDRVTTLSKGLIVTVVGSSANENETWYELTFEDTDGTVYQGYCLSAFVDLDGAEDADETEGETELTGDDLGEEPEDGQDETENETGDGQDETEGETGDGQDEDGWPRDGTTTAGVNLRSGPGTGYSRVTTLRSGAAVTVVGSTTNDSGEVWYELSVQGTNGVTYEGYCLSTLISLS